MGRELPVCFGPIADMSRSGHIGSYDQHELGKRDRLFWWCGYRCQKAVTKGTSRLPKVRFDASRLKGRRPNLHPRMPTGHQRAEVGRRIGVSAIGRALHLVCKESS